MPSCGVMAFSQPHTRLLRGHPPEDHAFVALACTHPCVRDLASAHLTQASRCVARLLRMAECLSAHSNSPPSSAGHGIGSNRYRQGKRVARVVPGWKTRDHALPIKDVFLESIMAGSFIMASLARRGRRSGYSTRKKSLPVGFGLDRALEGPCCRRQSSPQFSTMRVRLIVSRAVPRQVFFSVVLARGTAATNHRISMLILFFENGTFLRVAGRHGVGHLGVRVAEATTGFRRRSISGAYGRIATRPLWTNENGGGGPETKDGVPNDVHGTCSA